MIPYGRQDINQADIEAVIEVLQSDFLTQGPQVPRFEKSVANHVGVKYALAVNSATSALHIACKALELKSGDWLWTSPITFVASANCALFCGAKVDFVDIDPSTFNICPQKLSEKLIAAEKIGKLPKIVIPVHMCGQSCDMEVIHALSKKYGFKIIEDASHAVGGRYKNEFIGNCKYSDITIFSFHPVKIITTAEGGMALTNIEDLANKMDLFRSHGITRDVSKMTRESDGPWYYQQIELGYNYRMTELQGALGLSQMHRLDEYVLKRHQIALTYRELLEDLPLLLPIQHKDCYSSFHLYVVRLLKNKIKKSHRQIFESLREEGIGVNLHYIPVHIHPYYQNLGFKPGDFPESEIYYEEAISLPMFPTLNFTEQNYIVSALKRNLF
jgi:UDP-4-amino-4,6-dideoxy-N-acetyl-beta-L-altrosamine transaminase